MKEIKYRVGDRVILKANGMYSKFNGITGTLVLGESDDNSIKLDLTLLEKRSILELLNNNK